MIESSDLMTQQKTPGLGQAALQISDVHVRNRGTIVEFLVHSDPGADHPGVVLALEVTIVAQGKQGKVQLISLFFYGFWVTDLRENEILTEVRIITDCANANSCFLKSQQPTSRYPYVGCAVAMSTSGWSCAEIRIGFSGIIP